MQPDHAPGPGSNASSATNIRYDSARRISATEFVEVLNSSTLGERRPVDDPACIRAMLEHANLLCTAWDGDRLIGVARSVTDFE